MLGHHDLELLTELTAEVTKRGGRVLQEGDRVVALPPWRGAAVWLRLAGEDTTWGFGYDARDMLPISDDLPPSVAIELIIAVMDGGACELFKADGTPVGHQVYGASVGSISEYPELPDAVVIPVPRWSTT